MPCFRGREAPERSAARGFVLAALPEIKRALVGSAATAPEGGAEAGPAGGRGLAVYACRHACRVKGESRDSGIHRDGGSLRLISYTEKSRSPPSKRIASFDLGFRDFPGLMLRRGGSH